MRHFDSMKIYMIITLALWAVCPEVESNVLRVLSNGALRRARDVSGPSIPVTPKPPCPSFMTCPYPPYPRPTTKPPANEVSSEAPTKAPLSNEGASTESSPSVDLVDRFDSNKDSTSQVPSSSTELDATPKPAGLGNANGPSISATSKPPCPSYITCPYPEYPRPTTKQPAASDPSQTTTVNPNKELVDRIGDDNPSDKPSSVAEPDSDRNKPVGLGNANGPSISATQKPPCPSYITCPYPPYPRPTTKSPTTSDTPEATTVSSDKELVDRISADDNPSEKPLSSTEALSEVNKPTGLGNANGPSISATQKPPCPSYITCPYPPYPRPTTKSPASDVPQSTTFSPNKELANRIGSANENSPSNPQKESVAADSSSQPQELQNVVHPEPSTISPNEGESTTLSSSDDERKDGNSVASVTVVYDERQPTETESNIPLSTDQPASNLPSSQTPNDWSFPGSFQGHPTTNSLSSESTSDASNSELVEYAYDTDYPTRKPSISATQKPECPFYASCPYVYPKPTTASPYVNKVNSQAHAQASISNGIGALSNRIQPPLLQQTNPPNLVSYFGGGEPGSLESSTVDPIELGNQGAFLPIYSYVYGFDPYGQSTYYNSFYNRRPSILLTPRPFWPSYLKNPWIYPRPFGSYMNDQESSAESNEDDELTGSVEEERDQFETDPNIYN